VFPSDNNLLPFSKLLLPILLCIISIESLGQSLRIYPNPFSDTLFIELKDLDRDSVTLTFYDIYGNQVFKPFNNAVLVGDLTYFLVSDSLPKVKNSALYILRAAIGDSISIAKIVHNLNPTGVEYFSNQEFQIYPNPCTDRLKIQSDLEIVSQRVFSSSGKEIFLPFDKIEMVLNTSTLSKGTYFLFLSTAKGEEFKHVFMKF